MTNTSYRFGLLHLLILVCTINSHLTNWRSVNLFVVEYSSWERSGGIVKTLSSNMITSATHSNLTVPSSIPALLETHILSPLWYGNSFSSSP